MGETIGADVNFWTGSVWMHFFFVFYNFITTVVRTKMKMW